MAALAEAARSEDSLALMLPAALARAFPRALTVAAVCSVGLLATGEAALGADPVGAVLDRTSTRPVDVPRATARAQDRLRRKLGARALLQSDPSTGTPRIVARLDGFLTSASPRDPEAIALDYVREHTDAFGLDGGDLADLRLTAREDGPDGTVHLTWEQRSGGLPNVDGGLHAAVTSEGRLLNVRGGAIPDPEGSRPDPRVSAASAYETAVPGGAPAPNATTSSDAARTTTFEGGGRASLVRYRDDGGDRVGWRVLIPAGSSAFYDATVDARTGRLQRRINRVRFDAGFSHFDVNPRAESGVPSTDHRSGWLDSDTRLSGPYAHAISDLEDSISVAQATPPYDLTKEPAFTDEVGPSSAAGGELLWDYPPVFGPSMGFCTPLCSWRGSNRDQNREFSTAQLFWYVNTFHDHLAQSAIGFTGDNAALEGQNDRVLAQGLDGALTQPSANLPDPDHLNTASMLTLPDGYGALLQVHLFAFGNSRYDGAHDASLVYHEYTHGLTDRLVTDAQGFGAMSGPQPGALSEGLSDFYALDFLEAEHTPDDPDVPGEVRFGKWLQENPDATGLEDTLRTEGADCAPGDPGLNNECPGTSSAGQGGYDYSDFGRIDAAPEIHFDGEIWAQTLWSLRTRLIKDHDSTTQGLERVRAYVTGGLRLVPENPTFLDMRNAIVQAAFNLHGDQDWTTIWDVFAERGMGWSASTDGPNDLTPFAAGDVPPPPGDMTERGAADGTVTDETGTPVVGASVAVGGHDSGLGVTDLRTTTGNDGHYALPSVPKGSYPDLYVRKAGFQEMTNGLDVHAGITTTTNFAPFRRDYASHSSGGSVSSFTGPNFDGDGCGPAQALDDDKSTVWSTVANEGPQDLVIELGRGLDLREVRIDPRAGCGDGPEASLAEYELAASDAPGQPFERIAGGIVGPLDARGYVSLPLAGDLAGRRLLRLRAIAPRDLEQLGPGPYMDVSELEVTGTPVPVVPQHATPIPSPTPTPTLTPTPPTPVPKATLIGTKLTATLKGFFKVKAGFGDAAPLGTARFTVTRKGKRLARATTPVRQGRTVTKTLKLTRKGRKMIKPGRSKMVRVELRLPSGEKVKKIMKLTRKRR